MSENHDSIAKLQVKAFMGNRHYRRIHVDIARQIGILEAYLLEDLVDMQDYYESKNKLIHIKDFGDCFYYDHNTCDERMALGEKQMLRVIKSLVDQGLIDYQLVGIPPKRFFRINFERINEISKKCF